MQRDGKRGYAAPQGGAGILDYARRAVGALKGVQKYPGERHVPLILPGGKVAIANYAGPGTHLLERIKAGDPPLTEVDRISQAHDIRYSLARSAADVRAADLKMLDELSRARDNKLNIAAARTGIAAKVRLEKFGVPNEAFTTHGDNVGGPDEAMLAQALQQTGRGVVPLQRLHAALVGARQSPRRSVRAAIARFKKT